MRLEAGKRPRVAMISADEALRVLRAKWPEGMTARDVYFAARPPVTDADRALSGSAYARKALVALVESGSVVKLEDKVGRSDLFRVHHMPSSNAGPDRIEAYEVLHNRDVPPAPASAAPSDADTPSDPLTSTCGMGAFFDGLIKEAEARERDEVAGSTVGSEAPVRPTSASPGKTDPDPIATILLGMARAPRPGSRIDIVKIQAAEGIAWARAAGWTDHRIAQEILEASQLEARPEEIVHLVASVPGRPAMAR